jgi:hypothetical protein
MARHGRAHFELDERRDRMVPQVELRDASVWAIEDSRRKLRHFRATTPIDKETSTKVRVFLEQDAAHRHSTASAAGANSERGIPMLTRLIVDLYAWIIEISLWILLLSSALLGFVFFAPTLRQAGWVIEHEIAWSLFGALLCAGGAFLSAVVFVGPVVLLVDIRRSMRALESQVGGGIKVDPPARLPNPFAFEDVQPR